MKIQRTSQKWRLLQPNEESYFRTGILNTQKPYCMAFDTYDKCNDYTDYNE